MNSSLPRKVLGALFALSFLAISPTTAFAHAGLVSSNPAAETEVTVMPSEISLTFTEDLMVIGEKNVNSINLTYMKQSDVGIHIDLADLKVEGPTLSATIPAAEYESGSYRVAYSIVSPDGHKVEAFYNFSLNAPVLTSVTPVEEKSDGVLPLPIVGAIALVVILGGFYALRARGRKE